MLAHGTLTPAHATAFRGYVKIVRSRYGIEAILKGEAPWPRRVEDRDLLYYLADSFRGPLVKELPDVREHMSAKVRQSAYRAKSLLVQLAEMLVITDGWCDVPRVRREHAYLLPQGRSLPFTARGPVFRVR